MLQLEDVHFSFGRLRRRPIYQGLDWSVPEGKRTLLLGPNGAGKSTLLGLLAGYRRPQRGRVTLGGDASRAALFKGVAWMPQRIDAVRGLSVQEQVAYSAWLAGESRERAKELADELVHQVLLDDKSKQKSSELSGGQLRRLGLAQALARPCEVLLLDEPTAGLDPAQSQNFREILRSQPTRGGVLVSTHQVAELNDDFDHVTVVHEGRIRFDGSLAAFQDYGREIGASSDRVAEIFSHLTQGGLH